MQTQEVHEGTREIHLPTPTAWPMVLALGISLLAASMVTHFAIAIFGGILTLAGAIGWVREVLPVEAHETVPVEYDEVEIGSERTLYGLNQKPLPAGGMHRKILPVETFQIWSGIKGGLAGGLAMTVPAGIFSVVKYHSFWYAVNLLAAGGFVSWAGASNQFLGEFHWQGLLAATLIHGITSLLVGLLYGALLPMYPKYPIVTAGFAVPLLFTGLLHSVIGIVSPILNQRIEWFWFVASQVAFGLVCGYVVNLDVKVRTPQFQALPFAQRAGIHSDARLRADEEAQEKRGLDLHDEGPKQ
jgi:hypothetical protein